MPPLSPTDLPAPPAELALLAIEVASEAAEFVRTRRRAHFEIDVKSSPTDMVTEVDTATDTLIRERLTARRPDDGLLTEEAATVTGTSGIVWVVDPIDGTTNFVYGRYPHAVSIAATVDDTPVAAAVIEIAHGDRFDAWLGGGTRRDGTRLAPVAATPLPLALVATGFGYDPERRRRQAAVLERIIGDVRDVRRLGAASFDLCSVACGEVDVYYEHGLGPWDLAAGRLIASEAGCAVDRIAGGHGAGPLDGSDVIAGHPQLVEDLRALLVRSGVERVAEIVGARPPA
jgi:myo-inositol-1(or 4)-monophosphatase